ncbi:MAG: deoxyguanosinetriphosphate triphosphohydrolase family protein [Propionibacteriaceae bacterium]
MVSRPTRRYDEPDRAGVGTEVESAFRTDLERIRFAPSFARLAEVTQVVTSAATGGVVHNRLTHSIKVAAVARAIAVRLLRTTDPAVVDALGGLDHVVVQAAASAHDLGHPPFGHNGERVLDQLARERFRITDGFEGNAQTFRILTELAVHGPGDEGLNLTAAVRAAVLKYPWGRFAEPPSSPLNQHPSGWDVPPRGAGLGPEGPGAAKFSAYVVDLDELVESRNAFPSVPAGRQTLECAVMDLADDIAYSLHDVEDFHRAGVLQYSPVAGEFRAWRGDRRGLAGATPAELASTGRRPGSGLERLRRRLASKDDWAFDDTLFDQAVQRVGDDFVDAVLVEPYDGSMASDRVISGFVSAWIDFLIESVALTPEPHVRSAYAYLTPAAWHQVSVLKFVHRYFILDRPDLAMFQRGQAQTLTTLVDGFDAWLSDRVDAERAPRRLIDLVTAATWGYRRVAEAHPEQLAGDDGEPRVDETDLARMGRGRGIIDFVSGLTDEQAAAFAGRLSSSTSALWTTGAL